MDCSNKTHMLSDDKMKPLDSLVSLKKEEKFIALVSLDAHITKSSASFRYELVEMVYLYLSICN